MCQYQSINVNCSIYHTYTHDSKAVKQNVSTNFNRTERHAPVLHPIAHFPIQYIYVIYFLMYADSFTLLSKAALSLLLFPLFKFPQFNSLNNRPICTKRCMDVMPLRAAVTFQKIKSREIFATLLPPV